MKDFLGNQLAVGDMVAFIPNGYRDLAVAHILVFTPKQVRISYVNTWNYGAPGVPDETLRYPNALIKHVISGGVNQAQEI